MPNDTRALSRARKHALLEDRAPNDRIAIPVSRLSFHDPASDRRRGACGRLAKVLASLGIVACSAPSPGERPPGDRDSASATSVVAPIDAVLPASSTLPARHGKPPHLPPLADTIAQRLVFMPTTQTWFLGVVRDKLFGVDMGRVDIELQKPPGRLAAFKVAAEGTSPFEVGSTLRIRGPWGQEDAPIASFDAVGNRIVARLRLSPAAESTFAATPATVATAERIAAPAEARASSCDRTMTVELSQTLARAADSLLTVLRAGEQPVFTRLQKSLRPRKSVVAGCFGVGSGIAIASLSAGDYEWVRERAVIVGDSGRRPVIVRDLRYRTHEALAAFDADGDGIDDVALRAWTPRASGTVVLRLVDGVRLERLAAGFTVER